VSVLQCAVAPSSRRDPVDRHVLTTADPQMAQAYGQIEWAKSFHRGETLAVQQLRLDSILALEDIPANSIFWWSTSKAPKRASSLLDLVTCGPG